MELDETLLERIEDAVRRGGYPVGSREGRRGYAVHGFMAEEVSGDHVVVVWARNAYCCGTQEQFWGIPPLAWFNDDWDCYHQCGGCGAIGWKAPWMIVDATATDAEIARELAECSKPRNTFYYRDAAEIYAADYGADAVILPEPKLGDEAYPEDEE